MSEENHHYVYITTNLINGKQYVGDHTINPLEKKYYIGSGRPYLESAKKKYGLDNFFKEILEWFPTREEAFNAQEKYIQKYKTLSPLGYNISPKGGYGVNESFLAEETKNKIRGTLKSNPPFSEERKNNISKGSAGKIPWNKDKTGLYKTSEKTKDKQRKALKDKTRPSSVGESISKSLQGRNLSQEHKDNISKYQESIKEKIICPICHKEIGVRDFRRGHRKKCKNV
jgi:hypothetical protein